MQKILEKISRQYKLSETHHQRDDLMFITLDKNDIIGLLVYLRDLEGYTHFVNFVAVDRIEDNQFQLTYILNSPEAKNDIGIRTYIDREKPEMTSAHTLWKQVATYQREMKEMYGIEFPGSPRLNDPFFLEGWDDIPPMRRDFDTKKYAEETYFPRHGRKTTDPAEHMKEKLYPDDPTNK